MSLFHLSDKLKVINKIDFDNLQNVTEENLYLIFGFKLIASDYEIDNMIIDTLAFNRKSNSFVIINYIDDDSTLDEKAYSYLSLILGNREEFLNLYDNGFIDFNKIKIIFVTSKDFKSNSFYEVCKVVKYENNFITFDGPSVNEYLARSNVVNVRVHEEYDEMYHLCDKKTIVQRYYQALKSEIMNNFDNIDILARKQYIAFQIKGENIISVVLLHSHINIFIAMKEGTMYDPFNKLEDVSRIGHWGTGDYRYRLDYNDDFEELLYYFEQSYVDKIN